MADHDIKVPYFYASPKHTFAMSSQSSVSTSLPPVAPVKVRNGQTLAFSPERLDKKTTPSDQDKILVTFADKQYFHSDNPDFAVTGQYRTGDPPVVVAQLPPDLRSKYRCELLDSDEDANAEGSETNQNAIIAGGEIILAVP